MKKTCEQKSLLKTKRPVGAEFLAKTFLFTCFFHFCPRTSNSYVCLEDNQEGIGRLLGFPTYSSLGVAAVQGFVGF